MKNERILNALSRADDKYVEEAAPTKALKDAGFEAEGVQAEPVAVTAPKRKVYGSRIAAAACACVAVGGLVVWGAVGGMGNLTENPATADTGEEYAQTGSPESNGYHNFTMTQEELYDSVWSCYIPEYFPAGYSLLRDVQCVTANGVAPANYEAELFLWLSNGIVDPDTVGYNPIGFSVVVDNHIEGYADPDYDLQTLTVSDIAEMEQVGTIDCGHNVRIIVTRTYPELVPDEEIYKMIMSMPYAQYPEDITCRTEYLTSDEVYNTQFSDRLPAVLPNGYHIAGLSRYTYDQYPSGGGSISLYLSNGVEDPNLSNYCPIRYTVQTYPDDPDTSDKPMYQSIWDLTLDDVKAAMESGGFYTTFMGIDLIEVSFPYADRVSAADIYVMVKSAPCAVEPDAMTTVEHTLVYLSREELYNCQWHMFLPRYFPEGFAFDGYASYTPTGFMDDGVMTYRLTDKESGDQLEVTFTCDFEHGSVADAEIKLKELAVSDIAKVKDGALIDCGNGGSTLQVSSPEKVNDEELYKMLTSIPASDDFAASGIETVDLSEYIGADVPCVAFEQFYDVKRVEIRTKFNDRDTFLPFFDEFKSVGGFDGDFGSIVGYDGKNVYFENAGYVDGKDDSGRNITLFVRMIGMYDTENDSYRQLVRYYESDLEFIYADGEFMYYIVRETDGDEILRSTFYKRNMNDPIFGTVTDGSLLTVDGNISSPAVNGSYIYFAVESEGQYGIARFDMNEDVDAAIAANRPFVSMAVVPTAVEAVMPYRDGAAYNLQNDAKRFYYWNGEDGGETVFLFKTETDSDLYSGDVYSDGEIFYKVTEGQLFNGTDYDQKQFFDALDIMGLSVTDRVNLAYNNGVDDNPWYTFSAAGNMANADGMIVPISYTGLIYDAQNGWFTHVDPDKMYWARPCAGDWLLMFEGDEEYGLSITGDVYDDHLTLCIITRK